MNHPATLVGEALLKAGFKTLGCAWEVLARMLLVAAACACALAIAEIGVRLFYRGPLVMGYFTTYRADVGQSFLPNSWGRMRDSDWDYEFTINPQGFRGEEFRPRANAPAIAFLGDSYVFGYGVSEPHTISEQFKALVDGPVTVWNCGVYGYSVMTRC